MSCPRSAVIALAMVLSAASQSPALAVVSHGISIGGRRPVAGASKALPAKGGKEQVPGIREAFEANRLVTENKFAEAHTLYAAALKKIGEKSPAAMALYMFRGQAHLQEGKPSAALKDFDTALSLVPVPDAELPHIKGMSKNVYYLLKISFKGQYFSHYLLGEYEQAAECNVKLALLDPDDAGMTHIDSAVLYWLANSFERADQEFDAAVKADPLVKSQMSQVREICHSAGNMPYEERKAVVAQMLQHLDNAIKKILTENFAPPVAADVR